MQNFMVFSGAIFNGFAISHYLGIEAIAAFQLTLPLFFILSMISQIVAVGVQNNCAKSISMGRAQDANEYYSLAIMIIFPLSVILGVLVFFNPELLAVLVCSTDSGVMFLNETTAYLQGLALGYPFLILLPMQVSVLFLEGRSKWSLWSGFVQTVVKITAIVVNIFYLDGSMFGMGLVMTLGYATAFFVTLAGMRNGIIRLSLGFIDCKKIGHILRIGFPYALDRLYKSVHLWVIDFVLIFLTPSVAVAAFADINVVNNIIMPIIMGASSATLTMSGVFAGERDRHSLQLLLRTAIKIGVLVAFLAAICVFAAAPFLIDILVPEDNEVAAIAIHALRIYIWSIPFFALNNLLQKYYLGINAMKMTYLTSALDNLVFICLFAVILGYFFGADGVWFSFILAEIATTAALFCIIARQKGSFPRCIDDLLCLPKNFAASFVEKVYNISADSMQKILEISEEAMQLLLYYKAPPKEAMVVALTIEEVGKNIIQWGMSDNINIRIVKDDVWILRIRDNGKHFNPKEWLKIHQQDDPLKNIGIRMICRLASNLRYSRILDFNYLIIRL